MRLFTRIRIWRDTVYRQQQEIEIYKKIVLLHQRSLLELAVGFRLALEQPEVDISDELDAMIQELSYGIAQTEEYVV